MAGKRKHYAVARGRSGPAIYNTWDECSAQVTGFRGAIYKSFKTRAEAQDFLVKEGNVGSGTARTGGGTYMHASSDTDRFGAAVAAAGAASSSHGASAGIIDLCSQESDDVNTTGSTVNSNKKAKYEDDRKPAAFRTDSTAGSAAALSEPVDLCDSSDDEMAGDAHASSAAATYSSFAHKMMSKMGHTAGKGLGKAAQGITAPLAAVGRPGTKGGGPGVGFGSLLKTPNALQSKAIEAAKRGDNIFITGPAGTGKSVVLSHIMHHLKTKYRSNPNKYVAVAPTGPTAISVGGQTIHSFAGCGVPETAKDFEKVIVFFFNVVVIYLQLYSFILSYFPSDLTIVLFYFILLPIGSRFGIKRRTGVIWRLW